MKEGRVLLFDVMDTLVRDPFYAVFPAYFGLTFEALLAEKDDAAWPAFERGEIDEDRYFATAFKDRRAFDGAGLKAALYESYAFIPGVEAVLTELNALSVEMHVLSNYPIWYRMIEERLGLSRYLPWTFVSWHTGVRKPDLESYLGAARTLGREPAELIFVDDRGVNVKAAIAAGLDAIRFESAEQLRAELERRDVIPAS